MVDLGLSVPINYLPGRYVCARQLIVQSSDAVLVHLHRGFDVVCSSTVSRGEPCVNLDCAGQLIVGRFQVISFKWRGIPPRHGNFDHADK